MELSMQGIQIKMDCQSYICAVKLMRYSSTFIVLFSWCFCLTNSQAQVTVSGNIRTEITSIINAMPNDTSGNDFVRPTVSQLATWERTFTLLLNGNYADAEDSANLLNYSLTEFTDNSEGFNEVLYMLKNTGTNYWGTYLINPTYCRPLVIQSPHPKFDFNTGKQGIFVFRKTDAFCFMMSGAHRCSSSSFSSCAGTTGVCSNSTTAFRISDPAHFDSSIFHFTTRLVHNFWSNTYFIQLHGFTKGGSDPYVIMSNGTRDTPTVDYLDILDNKLFDEDNTLTFKLVHIDTTWTHLAGLTNTQGRFINGSSNPCSTSASTTTGRFLHLEQEKTRLRADEAGWTKMSNALNNTFSCGALPVELLRFDGYRLSSGNQIEWVTASETNNAYFELQRSIDGVSWFNLYTVEGAGFSNVIKTYWFIDEFQGNEKTYYRLKQVDYDGTSHWSKIISISTAKLKNINIHPNPATGSIKLDFPFKEMSLCVIYSNLGVEIDRFEMTGTNKKDISDLTPGMYVLKVMTGNEVLSRTFMVY